MSDDGKEETILGHLFLGIISLSGGLIVSSAAIALILELDLISRFAGITHTAHRTKLYEKCITAGVILGNLLTIYTIRVPASGWLAGCFGLFGGIYLGSWIMALAETIGVFPILFKKTGVRVGFSAILLAAAIGKSLFSGLYFFRNW